MIIIIETIIDTLRLPVYLYTNRRKNMNGMNLISSSPISEQNNDSNMISVTEPALTMLLPLNDKNSSKELIISAYAR